MSTMSHKWRRVLHRTLRSSSHLSHHPWVRAWVQSDLMLVLVLTLLLLLTNRCVLAHEPALESQVHVQKLWLLLGTVAEVPLGNL